MAPPLKETSASPRRKSLNPFSRSSLTNLPHINTDVANGKQEGGDKKKLVKRSSLFGLGSATSLEAINDGTPSPVKSGERLDSPNLRPRALQKGRPSSLFGSLGRRSTNLMDEGESDNLHNGTPESPLEDGQPLQPGTLGGGGVLYHGEIQTASGMFRKKKEYLALTDSHLVRFKSRSRASETFPSIPPSYGRSTSTRHPSTTSIGSLQEIQSTTSHTSSDGENRIPLNQIVTVYRVEDGRPFFTTEVVYLDEEYHGVGSIQLILHDPKEADLWLTSIRGAAERARLLMEEPYPDRVVRYLVAAVEAVEDYDADHFQVFRVVRRTSNVRNGRSSDDLQKLGSSVSYMVIGINRVHLIPLPDFMDAAGRLLQPKTSRSTYGVVSIVDIRAKYEDDRFELVFRNPLQPPEILEFAASAPTDIAIAIMKAWQYVRPQWEDHSFRLEGPRRLWQNLDPKTLEEGEDLGCFDRTLVAHCMAYNCNPVNIQYSVDWEAQDAPEFSLWAPLYSKKYSDLEILAIMRALRYNEIFRSISFRDIDLHCIHNVFDSHGADHVARGTRSGIDILTYFGLQPVGKSVLYQEVLALALKSRRVRKMDFSNTLPRRRPKDNFDYDEGREIDKDPGSEIVAALLPVCQVEATNVNWIVLSGIELGETDLDDIIPAFAKAASKIKGIEFSRCGLNDRGIMQIITHLERQNATLECLDISRNPGRIHMEQFQASMSRFTKIKRLNLSRTTWTPGSIPIILPEIMMTWKLEELKLNGIQINEETRNMIGDYLACDNSMGLRRLQMDQCGINGEDVAFFIQRMTENTPGAARELELHVSNNRLGQKGWSEIVEAVEANRTPSHLSLRMIEFDKEEHFRRLLNALRTNTSIRSLDISKASLPYDAGDETCEAMRLVFKENKTLEELDISGEQAHLEVTRFGIGLNHALTGLKKNDTLKVLRIEHQNLGLEGANTLADVLEQNKGLTHIFCEHNDINLQGFTVLVNAVANNHTLLVLPCMQTDHNLSMRRMNTSMRDYGRITQLESKPKPGAVRVGRNFKFNYAKAARQERELTPQDMDEVVRVLHERWEYEMSRLAAFLQRNSDIAAGVYSGQGVVTEETLRPTTALSDKGILEQVLNNTTPRVELGNPVEEHADNMANLSLSSAKEQENSKLDGIAEMDGEMLPETPGIGKEKIFELEGENEVFEMES